MFRLRLLLLRLRLRRAHWREKHLVAADHLIAVRKRLGDPMGRSLEYKREATAVIDVFVKATGANRTYAKNLLHKTVMRRKPGE